MSADANESCGKGLSLRSFASCGEAQVKPRGCHYLIWSSISPINGKITRTTLFGYSFFFSSLLEVLLFRVSVRSLWRTAEKKTTTTTTPTETGRHHCGNIPPF